jgi:phospholipid/cholesterol/gamma-HCH transport system substrate-binding protein
VIAVPPNGLVGNAFIQVGRGTDAAPMIEPGATIAGKDPIEFVDLIEEGRETFRTVAREFVDLSNDMSKTFGPIAQTARTANDLLVEVGNDVKDITQASSEVSKDARALVADTRSIVGDIRAGRGTIGQLLTDDSAYKQWIHITTAAEQTVANLQATTERTRGLIESVAAHEGTGQQLIQTLRDTLANTREVMSDLAEGTEALKRNFLFRGFFRDRGFFDLDTISREAYLTGALERNNRTALRVWIDAAMLFTRAADGKEQLTESGLMRLDSAMADLVRYPPDSPLIVEGYAESTEGQPAYLMASDRALLVRDYLLSRFRRRGALTGIMPMSDRAPGSPRGDDHWSGVALTLFVQNSALQGSR